MSRLGYQKNYIHELNWTDTTSYLLGSLLHLWQVSVESLCSFPVFVLFFLVVTEGGPVFVLFLLVVTEGREGRALVGWRNSAVNNTWNSRRDMTAVVRRNNLPDTCNCKYSPSEPSLLSHQMWSGKSHLVGCVGVGVLGVWMLGVWVLEVCNVLSYYMNTHNST